MYENHKKVSLYLILLMASSFTTIFQFPLKHKLDYRIKELFVIESKKLIKFAVDLGLKFCTFFVSKNIFQVLRGLQNVKVLKILHYR